MLFVRALLLSVLFVFGFVAERAPSGHNIYQQRLFFTGQRVSGFAALKAKQFKGNLQRAD